MKERLRNIREKPAETNLKVPHAARLLGFLKKNFKKVLLGLLGVVLLFVFALWLEVRDRVVLVSPAATPFFEDYQGDYISEGWGSDSPKGFWKIEGEIPHRVKTAFIAIEDKRFYAHSGIDWRALARAVVNNISGKPRHGASTIAMQVARMQNQGKRTYWKKLCETVTAKFLVKKFGHEEVMRQYLRLVPQGNRIHGAAYSARRFFRKPLQDLGWAEVSLLAALPKSPGRMNLFSSKGFRLARKRAEIVLQLLLDQNKININQYRVNLRYLRKLSSPMRETRPFHSLHAIRHIQTAMKAKGVKTFARPVRSSLDLNLQYYLTGVSAETMASLRPLGAGNIAIMVVEKETGNVRGYLGSDDYHDDQYAGAIDYASTPRSSGSTLKPFIYALGLCENKYTPSRVLADLPFYIAADTGQYIVANYDSQYLGPMLYRKALANSRNVPAVQVLQKTGLTKSHAFFKQIRLERSTRPASHYGLGMAVGGLYVTLSDLVRSYGILANYGKDFSLNWVEEIKENRLKEPPAAKGAFLKNRPPGPPEKLFISEKILPEDVCRQIALFLSDPLSRLPSFSRMGPLEYPFPCAVKTGTSQGFRDAWAIAWTGKYIVGVWIGHPNNDRMKKVSGLAAAAVVKRIMLHLQPQQNRGIDEIPFAPPRGYKALKVCTLSGQHPEKACQEILLEYFKPGTEPVISCNVHRQYLINRKDGELAGIHTPSSQVELKMFLTLPPRYSAWASRMGYKKPPIETRHLPIASVEIRNPVNKSQIMMDPETPIQFQTLPLKAKVTPAIPHIIWIVDGKEYKPTPYPYVLRWQLKPGAHTFQARFPNADVSSKEVTVSVSRY